MALLNPTNGAPNPAFNPHGANSFLWTAAVQADGKIVVGGSFTVLGGQSRPSLARLNADGSLDPSFNPGASGLVTCVGVQADGRILVGGGITSLAGHPCSMLARLNSDGSFDTNFNFQALSDTTANPLVLTFVIQADGRVIVGGDFSQVNGQPRAALARVNGDGSLDPAFNPGAAGGMNGYTSVHSLALQVDGKILAGGLFSALAGVPRYGIGRLNNSEPATQTLTIRNTSITWLRGGTGPEFWRTSFDVSTNGLDWRRLGAGTRIPGGWTLSAPTLPPNSIVRARGFVSGGLYNSSTWFVERSTWSGPVLASVGSTQSQFNLSVHARPGELVVLEVSTNLVTWVPLQTNLVTSSALFDFTDPDAPRFSHRFYRARLLSLPPPTLLPNTAGFPYAGQFGFELSGVSDQTVVIEASTNLSDWLALSTNTFGPTPLLFSDPGWTNFPSRFYRARLK